MKPYIQSFLNLLLTSLLCSAAPPLSPSPFLALTSDDSCDSNGPCALSALQRANRALRVLGTNGPLHKPRTGHMAPVDFSPFTELGLRVLKQGSVRLHSTLELRDEIGQGTWNLKDIFNDQPKGAYLNLLEPLTYACYLTYPTSKPNSSRFPDGQFEEIWVDDYNASESSLGSLAGDGSWERLTSAERDPAGDDEGGPHMRVLVDWAAKRAILAFRGACLDPSYHQCNNDLCGVYLSRIPLSLGSCGKDMLSMADYLAIAAEDVTRVRSILGPDFALMVTGHSLGGLFALTLDAVLEGIDFQVVALEPTPFGNILRHHLGSLGVSKTQLATFDPARRYAVYDPTDLLSTSFGSLEELRPHTTVCVYEGVPPPEECNDCVAQVISEAEANGLSNSSALERCFESPIDPNIQTTKCKDAAHFLDNYAKVLLKLKSDDGYTFLPTCKVILDVHVNLATAA